MPHGGVLPGITVCLARESTRIKGQGSYMEKYHEGHNI